MITSRKTSATNTAYIAAVCLPEEQGAADRVFDRARESRIRKRDDETRFFPHTINTTGVNLTMRYPCRITV
jgi:hypothetical protein